MGRVSGLSPPFPVTWHLGGFALSAHAFTELLAYVAGFALLHRERSRRGDLLDGDSRWSLNVAAILGAAVGSKLVHLVGDPAALLQRWGEWPFWLGGKSMVGGLVGGVAAVELAKARLGITHRTGDVLVAPLIAGIAIGRIGCFLAGLTDHTYGVPTGLPWGVDFGDGVARHPTQLYEIGFLLLLGPCLSHRRTGGWRAGARFDAFYYAYLAFRLGVDALKPYERFPGWLAGGLTATQWACLVGIAARAAWSLRSPRAALQGAAP